MPKEDFSVTRISKHEAASILDKYHYLKDISKGFKSGVNYGCFHLGQLVGVIIFTGLPVPELLKGMLGLDRDQQEGMYELSRLCLVPEIQVSEHNLASWFVSKAVRLLRSERKVKVILSYADANFHSGTVYSASNFNYYGLTSLKKDFFYEKEDGTFVKHSRGKVKGRKGQWRERTRKHRFVLCFDKTIKVRWKAEKWKNSNALQL